MITAWWRGQYRGMNVGIACGVESDLIVIDVDVRNGGDKSIVELEKKLGTLPPTVRVDTPSGGWHLYYRYPNGRSLRNKAGFGLPGVDVRGEGGQVVAPPSTLPNGAYQWRSDFTEVSFLPESWVRSLEVSAPIGPEAAALVKPADGQRQPLRGKTAQFLIEGAGEGQRNAKMFEAAAEMAGNGWPMDDIRAELLRANARCRPPMDVAEIDLILKSVAGKPRTPYIDAETMDLVGGRGDAATESTENVPRETSSPVAASPVTTPAETHYISNVAEARRDTPDGPVTVTIAKPITLIAKEIYTATGDWPHRQGTELFVIGDYDRSAVPPISAIRWLRDHNQFFAWLQERHDLHWSAKRRAQRGKQPVSPVNRMEMVEWFKANAEGHATIELLPHEPSVPGAYYLPFDLPPGDGTALAEFAKMLNGETYIDNMLVIAALLTPGWGGPPGCRPAFVFASDFGRGTGKTETAELIAAIWGGRITTTADKDDWKQARSRLLDNTSAGDRVVLIDNVKHKLAGGDLESMITTPIIDGHKMYVGQCRRPNYLTFIITANRPRLSADIADRGVLVKFGKQSRDPDWKRRAMAFVAERRVALVADLMSLLRLPPRCEISTANRDRWGQWQQAILTRFERGDELAAAIIASRGQIDADADDADDYAEAIDAACVAAGIDTATTTAVISRQSMRNLLLKHDLVDKSMNVRAVTTLLSNLIGKTGGLAKLSMTKTRTASGQRAWLWAGGELRRELDIESPFSGRA